jgi:EpsI family protein
MAQIAEKDASMTKLAVALAFLGLNFYTYHHFATDPVLPDRELFENFPNQLEDWHCPERELMDTATIDNLGVTDYLICNFQKSESRQFVNVYVGYHASQVREEGGGGDTSAIHPPAHCLPGSGWDIIDNRSALIDIPGLPDSPAEVKRLVVARGNARQLTYYWYQSRGRVVSRDWQKILYVGFDRATQGRTDGSLIRFTIPIIRNDEESADQSFHELAPLILARIPAYVPE